MSRLDSEASPIASGRNTMTQNRNRSYQRRNGQSTDVSQGTDLGTIVSHRHLSNCKEYLEVVLDNGYAIQWTSRVISKLVLASKPVQRLAQYAIHCFLASARCPVPEDRQSSIAQTEQTLVR